MTRSNLVLAALAVVVYLAAITFGLYVKNVDIFWHAPEFSNEVAWRRTSRGSVPHGPAADSIRKGSEIFEHTSLYAPAYTSSQVSCGSCHAAGGTQPYAVPLVGAVTWFPMFSRRAGHRISLADRLQECFVRSENGRPLPNNSRELKALLDYIEWLHTSQKEMGTFRGLALLPEMQGDPKRGAAIYTEQCAGCHGDHGQGSPPLFPPLWGPPSFNDGAGMNHVRKMASFVQRNMPQNRMGTLTAQQAFDVSAFIHLQPRPHLKQKYSGY